MSVTPVSTIKDELVSMESDLLTLGAFGIGIGAAVFALKKGWNVVRGFIR